MAKKNSGGEQEEELVDEGGAPLGKKEAHQPGPRNIDKLLESLQDKFGEGSVMKLGDWKKVHVDAISTGSFSLDLALGVGGLPRGRIVEVYGPESSGKTTLALNVVAQAQKKGGKAAFIDAEHALDPEYAEKLGVNVKELIISQPDNGEEALNILESLVRSEMITIAVVDSVAALTPKAEIEGDMGDLHIGRQARLMSQALRKLTAIAAKTDTLIIFINQIRMKIGVMFGNPETTPGGQALKFYSSVRVDIRRIAQIKKGEEVVGNRIKAKVVKNKVAAPFRVSEFDISYGEGISYEADVVNTALKYNVVSKTGLTYYFEEHKLGVGLENAKNTLKEDKKLLHEIAKKTEAAAK